MLPLLKKYQVWVPICKEFTEKEYAPDEGTEVEFGGGICLMPDGSLLNPLHHIPAQIEVRLAQVELYQI
jgi:hypothetical protein